MSGAESELPGTQVMVCCYHKTGTVLFRTILQKLAAHFGLRLVVKYGMVNALETDADIFMLAHSLLGFVPTRPIRGIRVVRDPRDIWLSGYSWHRHCDVDDEPWCVRTAFDLAAPIRYPQVPASFEHRRERWKRDFVAGLAGKSYQQNLLDRDRDAGLAFELDRYTGFTMDCLRAWQPVPGVIDIRLEDVAADFDGTMARIFTHMGFRGAAVVEAVGLAVSEDVGRMDDARVAADPHIHSRKISRWREQISPEMIRLFESRYGDVIVGSNYRLSDAA